MVTIDEGQKIDRIDEQVRINSTNEWDELIGKLQDARAKINDIIQ